MTLEQRLMGAVLAGGRSRRFGRDKTAAPVDGVPMVERAVDALAGACAEVFVVSSRSDTPRGPWRIVPDTRPGRGPLAGIEAALAEARPRPVFILAADLPLVDRPLTRRLAEAYVSAVRAEPTVDAVAAAREGGPGFEPLCAVYGPRCLGAAKELLDGGASEARALFESVEGRVARLSSDAVSVNVNTEAERAEAEARLRRGDDR